MSARPSLRRALWVAAGALLFLLATGSTAEAQCSISTTPVGFGTYDVLSSTPRDTTGTVVYNCIVGVPVTVQLGRGLHATSFVPRKMSKGSGPLLSYNLHMDAARTIIWGDNSSGTSHYTNNSPPTLTNVTLTIYARIPPAMDVTAGSYSDTVVATIIF